MQLRLSAFVNRETLISLRSIRTKISYLFFSIMSETLNQSHSPHSIEQNTPIFDPSQPSIPISYPIKTLEELESRSYFKSFHFAFNKATVRLPCDPESELPKRERVLVCHDMGGGYLDDKWVQGGKNPDAYAIWHWYLIDVFVYFSHSLVTIPPPCWTNAAHKHGVKVLGTFITEWDEGRIVCSKLLATKESARMYAERLTELAVALGFDGWLINMEVKLDAKQIPNLKEFVSHLTHTMHSSKPGSLVIWYDSVTVQGKLDWQDRLNDENKPFFDLCDGIFVNYTWKENYPKLSADVAGERKFDVYMGIDVFGRNTYGGGQWKTNVALDVIRESQVSAAIFAPGWVYETKQPPDFQTAQNRWWDLIEKSWGIMKRYPAELPFFTSFDQGHGHHFSVDETQVSNTSWCNISCQGYQPFLEFAEEAGSDSIQVLVDFKESSYSGGGNITFKGNLEGKAYFTTRLFLTKLLLGDLPLNFTYSVKSDGNSMLGLALEFSSTTNKKQSVLLASHGDSLLTMTHFSTKFHKIIMPHPVTRPKNSPDWTLHKTSIIMPGYTLNEIGALCYNLNQTHPDPKTDVRSKFKFYAILGHLGIENVTQNIEFPHSTAWIVNGESIHWDTRSKTISVNLIWRLTCRNDHIFRQFNVYGERKFKDVTGKFHWGLHEYLGVAHVEAFYVSELAVHSGTCRLKFIVQVCGADGSCQSLDLCPKYELDVEG